MGPEITLKVWHPSWPGASIGERHTVDVLPCYDSRSKREFYVIFDARELDADGHRKQVEVETIEEVREFLTEVAAQAIGQWVGAMADSVAEVAEKGKRAWVK